MSTLEELIKQRDELNKLIANNLDWSKFNGHNLNNLCKNAIINKGDITKATIPDSVTSLGEFAFHSCEGLPGIIIPDSVKIIGGAAFGNCNSLTNITIPDSLTSIGNWAFSGCSKLPSITIPKSVTSIGEYAFSGCTCHIIFECDESVVTKSALLGFEGTYEFK